MYFCAFSFSTYFSREKATPRSPLPFFFFSFFFSRRFSLSRSMAKLRSSLLLGGPVWWMCLLAARSISTSTINYNSSSDCNVSNKDFGPPFNSTGTVSFNLGSGGHNGTKPWYLTVGLKDKRDPNAVSYKGTQTVNSYISMPDEFLHSLDGGYTNLCAYRLGEQNTTAAEGNGSCNGVLSAACTKYIQTFRETMSFSNGKCPEFSPGQGCGDEIIASSTFLYLLSLNLQFRPSC